MPPTVPKEWQEAFKDAFVEADDRLLKKNSCSSLFGGTDNARTTLFDTDYRLLPMGLPTVKPNGDVTLTSAATAGRMVIINSQGNFRNPQILVPGKSGAQTLDLNTGLRGKDWGALLLLHELGHRTKTFGADAGNAAQNEQNSKTVHRSCFR